MRGNKGKKSAEEKLTGNVDEKKTPGKKRRGHASTKKHRNSQRASSSGSKEKQKADTTSTSMPSMFNKLEVGEDTNINNVSPVGSGQRIANKLLALPTKMTILKLRKHATLLFIKNLPLAYNANNFTR